MTSCEKPPLVWDRVVRLTHWSVAALVLWNLYEDSGGPLHRNLGYVATGLVVFRLVWGFIGSKPARFASWLPMPSATIAYMKALLARNPPRFVSHNPLGGLSALAFWGLILGLAVTGWMSRLDRFWGEDWLLHLHAVLADAMTVLAATHVSAAMIMSRVHKENLIKAMITGRKRVN